MALRPTGAPATPKPSSPAAGAMAELASLLVCPKCRGKLSHDVGRRELVCAACRLAYRIEGEVPVMLLDEARPL